MGLFCAIYEFRDHVPSIEEVERAVNKLVGETVLREGTLILSASDKAEKKGLSESEKVTNSGSLRLSSPKATLRSNRKRERRLKLYVTLHVSLRKKEVVVMGNDVRLAKATCEALKGLGETEWVPPSKKKVAKRKRV